MIIRALAAFSAAFILSGCSTVSVSKRQAEYRIDRSIDKVESSIFIRSSDEPVNFSIIFNDSKVDFVESKSTTAHQDVNIVLNGELSMHHPKYLIETPIDIFISAHAEINGSEGKLLLRDFIINDAAFKELYTSLSKDLRAPIANASSEQIESQLKTVTLIDTKMNGQDYSKVIKRNKITLVRNNVSH